MKAFLDTPELNTPGLQTWSLTVYERPHATALLAAHAAIELFESPKPADSTDANAERIRLATSKTVKRLQLAESSLPDTPKSDNEGVTFPMEEAQILAGFAAGAIRLASKLKRKKRQTTPHLLVLENLNAHLDWFFQDD